MKLRLLTAVFSLLAGASAANATLITFTDANLASGNPVTVGGVTLTTTTVGGNISFISSGQFAGLWLGGNNSSGSYTLSFSQAIDSIEIEFDALSSIGTPPVETLSGFATSNGPVTISFTAQFGTTFDGTTITSTENDGQGIINFAGAAFNSFSFNHNQGAQSGFVIEHLVINTAGTSASVPEPASLGLLAAALLALGFERRRRAR
ncbi:MAG: PEP-CTERM sorting domain-containing protein [Pseudomonadota bacterium]